MDPAVSGKPKHILQPKQDGGFQLDEDALKSILLAEEIKDKPIVVIAVVGALRKGKSFLLNFLLWYLRNGLKLYEPDKTEDANSLFEGFDWRPGSSGYTTGIWLSSQPFLIRRSDGEEVAVLLMDTQGMFDMNKRNDQATKIFSISALSSSVLVYNLQGNVQRNDMNHLAEWLQWAKLAVEHAKFQKLLFLVRDWSNPTEMEYGEEGGSKFLRDRLKIPAPTNASKRNSQTMDEDMERLRGHISDCFEEIGGFLLPHPGLKIAIGELHDGRLPNMQQDFKEYVLRLGTYLLAPEKLVTKKIDNREITCSEWASLFPHYVAAVNDETLPKLESLMGAKSKAQNTNALEQSMVIYKRRMEEVCGSEKPFQSCWFLKKQHREMRDHALEHFNHHAFRGEHYTEPYRRQLKKHIQDHFDSIVQENGKKKAFATPVVLLLLLPIFAALTHLTFLPWSAKMMPCFEWLRTAILIALLFWCIISFISRWTPMIRMLSRWMDHIIYFPLEKISFPLQYDFRERIWGCLRQWFRERILQNLG